jgi:predicted enzyme related to lactoylglutathione lyase
MTDRNALIFVDFPSPDPRATATFYAAVMGWETEPHPEGVFHLLKPNGEFILDDGTSSGQRNLNMGAYSLDEPRPDPSQRTGSLAPASGAPVRVYIANPDRAEQKAVLDRAEEHGASVLWRDYYWKEFEGFHGAFRDPWGNQVILWTHGKLDDAAPERAPY